MTEPLTLMAVHAHPDDEAITTGGVLARAAAEGIRTVLVTCTNGELGDGPAGMKPDTPEHDGQIVAAMRLGELKESCAMLDITHLELLGYHDSGMMGWPQNDLERSFWKTPIEESTQRLAELFEQYRPDVVVTYDENGFYGHPDHIQANRITTRAAALTGIPRKIYHTAVGITMIKRWAQAAMELSPERAHEWDFDLDNPPFGVPDETITTFVDVAAYVERKHAAMAAHKSQSDTTEFLAMPAAMFAEFFGVEPFVRVLDTTVAPIPEDDLFAGLR